MFLLSQHSTILGEKMNLKPLFDAIEKICTFILMITLGGMCIFIAAQVVFRFVINKPLSWTEEAARHLMIWSAFIGSAIAYRRKAHLGIEIFSHYLLQRSAAMFKVLKLTISTLTIILSLLIIHFGIQIVFKTMKQLSSALSIPMGFIYAAIPVGFFFILIFTIENVISELKADSDEKNSLLSSGGTSE